MGWLLRVSSSLGAWLQVVGSLAAGWALNELSQLIRLRREDRRAAGPVVTDLLEIRHQLMTLDAFKKELTKHFPIPAQAQLQLQNWIQALLPAPPKLVERYEEAVSTLAHIDPLTAFRLRGQTMVGPLLTQLRGLAALKQSDSEFWLSAVEPQVLTLLMPHLEELILDVARAHGWSTWWRARCRLRRPHLSESEAAWISEWLAKVKAAASVAAGT